MKKLALIFVLFVAIYSLTSCASNRGHGCGYWSATEIPQQKERLYEILPENETTCTDSITTD